MKIYTRRAVARDHHDIYGHYEIGLFFRFTADDVPALPADLVQRLDDLARTAITLAIPGAEFVQPIEVAESAISLVDGVRPCRTQAPFPS